MIGRVNISVNNTTFKRYSGAKASQPVSFGRLSPQKIKNGANIIYQSIRRDQKRGADWFKAYYDKGFIEQTADNIAVLSKVEDMAIKRFHPKIAQSIGRRLKDNPLYKPSFAASTINSFVGLAEDLKIMALKVACL